LIGPHPPPPARIFIAQPRTPYTRALIAAAFSLDIAEPAAVKT
jgi:hypothetical protein